MLPTDTHWAPNAPGSLLGSVPTERKPACPRGPRRERRAAKGIAATGLAGAAQICHLSSGGHGLVWVSRGRAPAVGRAACLLEGPGRVRPGLFPDARGRSPWLRTLPSPPPAARRPRPFLPAPAPSDSLPLLRAPRWREARLDRAVPAPCFTAGSSARVAAPRSVT